MANNIPNIEPLHHEKEVHLLDYLHVVLRRWRIALIVFLVVFVGVVVHTLQQVPLYQTSTSMRVGYKTQTSAQVLEKRLTQMFSVASELQLLQSYDIAEQASQLLGLTWQQEAQHRTLLDRILGRKKIDVHLRDLMTPEGINNLTLELTGPQSYLLRNEDGQVVLTGDDGELVESGDYRARIIIHDGDVGDKTGLRRLDQDELVRLMMSGVSAREQEEGAFLISLSVTGTDPMLIADVANALAKAYAEHDRANMAEQAMNKLKFIDQQLIKVSSDLNNSEQALHEYRIATGLERLSTDGQNLVDNAVELEKAKADLNLSLVRIRTFLNEFKWGGNNFTAISELPGVDELIKQLFSLQAKRVDLLRKFMPAHPSVVELDEQINQIREKITSIATLAKSRIEQQLADIEVSLGRSSQQLKQLPEEELELVRLSRANQVNAELYTYLLQRQQETRIVASATTSKVEVINRAQVPGSPISPNNKKNLALGLILGLMTGIGLTFLLDYLDRTIKDEDDVIDKLGLQVIGTIPRIKEAENNEVKQLVTQLEPMSPASESFLALRTNLLNIITNEKHKTVLLTSCLPDEGKSTVAVNLAATLAQTGSRTLLVGCDLRRPSLYKALGETEVPGLTDLLMNDEQSAVRKIEHLGLDFIPGGTEPPNPTQLLNSGEMLEFLDVVNHRYDYVILDVPPLLPVSDALIIASKVDLNVMVIESCRVPEKIAKRALNSLYNHNASIAGVVLNDKSGKGAKYYGAYSYYEGKYYHGYYRRDQPEPVPPLWRRVLSKMWSFING